MDDPLGPGIIVNSRYKIIRSLGSGAFGEVYLGKDLREKGAIWALKEVFLSGMSTFDKNEFLNSFRNEAELLTTLSHPGIPRVTDYFITRGSGFLVMERVEGLTLEEIARNNKKPLAEIEVLSWALQICDTLEYLHSQDPPIIYRDLKPSNLMLTIEERIVIIDFGIARLYSPDRPQDTAPLGTPGYSPPEQYGKSQTTPASDIYSLGTTLYYLLTLKDMASFNFKFPPIGSQNPRISVQLGKTLAKCLEWSPGNRYQSARELKTELEGVMGSLAGGGGFLRKYGRYLKGIRLDRVFPQRNK